MAEKRLVTINGAITTRGTITGLAWKDIDGNPKMFDLAQPLAVDGGDTVAVLIEVTPPPPAEDEKPLIDGTQRTDIEPILLEGEAVQPTSSDEIPSIDG